MAGAFQLLRSNDLVWSRRVRDYLMGERAPMTDLMALNGDSIRMPYRMHSEYLRRLYLDNELAAGHFMVDERAAALQNIHAPKFVVGTERDHVAPWRSVYTIHCHTDTDITFVLTGGGHNTGIVSESGQQNRHFRIALKNTSDPCLDPDEWAAAAASKDGHGGWLGPIGSPITLQQNTCTHLRWGPRTVPRRSRTLQAHTSSNIDGAMSDASA
jgi:polyhydroxyalkanoate synthase subunit PhaC